MRRLFGLMLLLTAMLLSACGGAPAESPTAAPAAATPPAAPPTAAAAAPTGAPADAATELKTVTLTGALPEKALVHIRHSLFSIGTTPGKIGFALGLRQETDELLRHAQCLKDAFDTGNFALEKPHAEHIVNII